jgi:hypothetical protein
MMTLSIHSGPRFRPKQSRRPGKAIGPEPLQSKACLWA